MEYVYKMAETVSELSYLYRMENLSNTLLQRRNDAMFNVNAELNSNKELEQLFWRMQGQCIRKSQQQGETTEKQ